MIFNSRRYFEKQTLEIKNSSVHVNRKGLLDAIEYDIPFENIGSSKVIGVYANNSAFVASFFCIIITVFLLLVDSLTGSLIFGFISLIGLAYGLITRVRMVTVAVYSGEDIRLYFNKNNREEAILFADALIEKVRSYLKDKYSKFDRLMPLDKQFDDLYFLKERDLITDAEYEEFKAYLLSTEKRSIGFNK